MAVMVRKPLRHQPKAPQKITITYVQNNTENVGGAQTDLPENANRLPLPLGVILLERFQVFDHISELVLGDNSRRAHFVW